MTSREPPLLMNNCQINPEWERWLKTNYPDLSIRGTNANVMLKMLRFRATIDIVLKESWGDYAEETLELLRECPEDWDLLLTMDPPKPTMLQRLLRFIKR